MSFEYLFQQTINSGFPPSPVYLLSLFGFMALNPNDALEGLKSVSTEQLDCRMQSARSDLGVLQSTFKVTSSPGNPFADESYYAYKPLMPVPAAYSKKGFENYAGLIHWCFGALIEAGKLVNHTYKGGDGAVLEGNYYLDYATKYYCMPEGLLEAFTILLGICQIHRVIESSEKRMLDYIPIAIEDAKNPLQRDPDYDQIRSWETYSTEQNVAA